MRAPECEMEGCVSGASGGDEGVFIFAIKLLLKVQQCIQHLQ